MAAALWQGGTLITMPRFDLEQFLTILRDRRVNVAAVVSPIVLALAKHPLMDRVRPVGADCVVGQGYGLTETSPVLTAHPREEARIRHGSAGQWCPTQGPRWSTRRLGRRRAATGTASCASAARR